MVSSYICHTVKGSNYFLLLCNPSNRSPVTICLGAIWLSVKREALFICLQTSPWFIRYLFTAGALGMRQLCFDKDTSVVGFKRCMQIVNSLNIYSQQLYGWRIITHSLTWYRPRVGSYMYLRHLNFTRCLARRFAEVDVTGWRVKSVLFGMTLQRRACPVTKRHTTLASRDSLSSYGWTVVRHRCLRFSTCIIFSGILSHRRASGSESANNQEQIKKTILAYCM